MVTNSRGWLAVFFRLTIALLAVCSSFSTLAVAESTNCLFPVLIVPDGRLTQSTFPQNATFWFAIYTQAYHSYSDGICAGRRQLSRPRCCCRPHLHVSSG